MEKRTNGRVEFETFWAGSLLKTTETIDGVASGFVDVGLINAPNNPDRLPLINMQMPVFFSPSDPAVLKELYGTMIQNPAVRNDVERYGVKLLYAAAVAAKDLCATKPINTIEDLNGVKIGTIGIYYPKIMQAIGAVPVNTPAPQMYQSLQTGVIEAECMGIGSILSFRLHEVAKYATWVGFGSEIVALPVINNDTWVKLPRDIQEIMTQTAIDATIFNVEMVEGYTANGVKGILEAGGTINELPYSEKVKWANLMDNYPAEWAHEMDLKGLPGTEVMQLFLNTCRRLGHKFPRQWTVE